LVIFYKYREVIANTKTIMQPYCLKNSHLTPISDIIADLIDAGIYMYLPDFAIVCGNFDPED